MKHSAVLLIAFIFFNAGPHTYAQNSARDEFRDMYTRFTEYDDVGNYKQIISELTLFIEKYPDYKQAGKFLSQILRKYKEQVMLDGETASKVLKYKEYIPPDFIDIMLVYYYNENNVEKVYDLLSIITESDTSVMKLQLELLLHLDPKINNELYNQIITNVKPLITFSPVPERYVLYYNTGLLNEVERIYSGLSAHIPLGILGQIDPGIYPDLYLIYFSESLPNNASMIIDSVQNKKHLFNLMLQLKMMGRITAYTQLKNYLSEIYTSYDELYQFSKYLYTDNDLDAFALIQKRIYEKINPADTLLSVKFSFGLSSLYLRQYFRAEQMFMHIFLYGKQNETDYYRKEIEWWRDNNLEPEFCNKFLAAIFGTSEQKPDNIVAPAEIKTYPIETRYGVHHAFLIGVQNYMDPSLQDLTRPLSDAESLKELLIAEYNFDPLNIVLMQDPRRENIIEQFYTYRNNLNENDNLLVFYAGHGTWDEDSEQGYWLPADAQKDNKANWINNSDLRDYIKTIKTRHTLLITDACFSGGIFKLRDIQPDRDRNLDLIYKHTSRKAITSGSLKEVPDESVFIEYLIKRLKDNEEKYLTASDLFYSLKDAVRNNSHQVPLYGAIFNTGDDDFGDYIFVKK